MFSRAPLVGSLSSRIQENSTSSTPKVEAWRTASYRIKGRTPPPCYLGRIPVNIVRTQGVCRRALRILSQFNGSRRPLRAFNMARL